MVSRQNKHKILVLLLLSIIIFTAVPLTYASNLFSADYVIVKAGITPEEAAEYMVTIQNLEDTTQIYTLELKPSDAGTWILSPGAVSIPAQSSKTFPVKLFPTSDVGLGVYQVELRINAGDGSIDVLNLPISVNIDAYYFGYSPDVSINIVSPTNHDPREPLKIIVHMRNKNQLDISNLNVIISGDLFYNEFNTSLGPRKEKSKDVVFELDPLQTPGKYNFDVKLVYPLTQEIITEASKTIEIDGYSQIVKDFSSTSSWFLTTETITLRNEGNSPRSQEISLVAPWSKRIFMNTMPQGELVEVNNKASYMWEPTLNPLEEKTIVIKTNYRLLMILILILFLLVIAYFLFRSPIVVLKESVVVKEDNDGVSEIKVRVFVKNRARKAVHAISIMDKIPRITELVPTNQLGSLKPSRVTNTSKKGTLLYWDLDRLESYEERILTYRINSKLRIVGDLSLPKVKVRFQSSSGKERTVISSKPLFIRQ